jgi:serine/threonine-protein kinase
MAHEDDDTVSGAHAPALAAGHHQPTQIGGDGHLRIGTSTAGSAEGAVRALGSWRPQAARAGDYLLGDIVGEGGFGVVYRAEHAERHTLAAVKIPHPDLVNHPSSLARFEREIEALRRLRHPNIVEILDVGQLEDGRPYFAMEMLTGTSLDKHLRSRGRLSPDEALGIFEPLCSALEAAHAHAVVHRDIKPSNIFLGDEAGCLRVVLLDFGIAKMLDATGSALTSSHAVVGTLAYIAPEQLLGRAIDRRTDVYALGVLLYTMLTGASPFDHVPYPTLHQVLLEGPVPRPSARARVSPALEEVILRAMSRPKEGRYPSVTALLTEVRRAATHDPGSSAETTGAPVRHAIGVYVEALADSDVLDAGDERLLADFESILPRARHHLAKSGLSPAVEAGTSMLFIAKSTDDPAHDAELRRGALRAVLCLYRSLLARPERDPRVGVHLCVHRGELLADARGALVGGDLVELAAWVPERPAPGVFASAPVLVGLGMAEEPSWPSAGPFLCITGAATNEPPDASR